MIGLSFHLTIIRLGEWQPCQCFAVFSRPVFCKGYHSDYHNHQEYKYSSASDLYPPVCFSGWPEPEDYRGKSQ